MNGRAYTRRTALQAIGLGAVGTLAASAEVAEATAVTPDGQRPDERIQFVEAKPEAGFNFPYWVATPETFRSEPVPLLVTGNKARPGQPLTGGGPDQPTTVAESSRSEITSYDQVGAWATEKLGVPQLVPVIPKPSRTQWTTHLDRESMLIEGTDLERVDRQLLRMTEHARQHVLADHEMHEQLLFWGNSSSGVTAEHMAVLHPEAVLASVSSGTGGVFTLPLEELGGHTLKYPVGVADFEEITGKPFDPEAFDAVNKFYIYGGHDGHNLLKFQVPGELPGVWADPEVYETAKAVYGLDMDEDRMPRCHIAYEKAGVSGQFRIYPEMGHDPGMAGPDVLEFFRRSIEGEDVSEFGQRLTLPFDRTVALDAAEPSVGDTLEFTVSGEYPPPEGLVTYAWEVDDGRSASGTTATFTFEEAQDYDLSLTIQTAHGQVAHRGMSLLAGGESFAAYRYDVTTPATDLLVGEGILIELDVTNVGSVKGNRRLELFVDGDRVDSRGVGLDPGDSHPFPLSTSIREPGEFKVEVPPAYKQTITVKPKQAELVLLGADVWPNEVDTGEPTRVTAMVTNGGTGSGEVSVTLTAGGERLAQSTVSLGVNETKLVAFEPTFEEPGTFELALNDEAVGTVTVAAEPTPTRTASPPPDEAAPESSATATVSTSPTEGDQAPSPTDTESSGQPGFGLLTALAGIGSAVGYLVRKEQSDDP